MVLRKWPDRIPHRNGAIKAIPIAFRGLIQVLHFCCKQKAPTPSELKRHGVWPSWFHKMAKECKYAPSNNDYVIVSLVYCINALRIKYGVEVPYNWELLSSHTDEMIRVVYFHLRVRPRAPKKVRQPSLPVREEPVRRVRENRRLLKYMRKQRRKVTAIQDADEQSSRPLSRSGAVKHKTRSYVPPRGDNWCDLHNVKMRRVLLDNRTFPPNLNQFGTSDTEYPEMWRDAISGLMTGDQLRMIYGDIVDDHRYAVAESAHASARPFRCKECLGWSDQAFDLACSM